MNEILRGISELSIPKITPHTFFRSPRGNLHNSTEERPIYEGRIYIPSPSFDPNEQWFETNLNNLKKILNIQFYSSNI